MKMDFMVRDIDDGALAKIDMLARKRGISRNRYVVEALESLAILGELKAVEEKYSNLVNVMADVVEKNTEALRLQNEKIDQLMETMNYGEK